MHATTRERLKAMKERRQGRTFKRSPAAQSFKVVTKKGMAGTFLSSDIAWLTGIKGGSGCGCKNLASEMNSKGADWCEMNAEYIVGKMVANTDQLAAVVHVPELVLRSVFAETALRAGARVLLWNAIRKDRARAEGIPDEPQLIPVTPPRRQRKRLRKSRIGTRLEGVVSRSEAGSTLTAETRSALQEFNFLSVRDARAAVNELAGGLVDVLGCERERISNWLAESLQPPSRNRSTNRTKSRGLTIPLMKSQIRLHNAAMAAPKPSPAPFVGEPVRNMIWHIWPVEGWRKHIERIKELATACDGQRIIGLSICAESETANAVRKELGDGFTYLEFENKGQSDATGSGEVQTLRAALPMLDSSNPDSVTAYGHCKGVRVHTRDNEAVQLWCDLMWELVLLNHDGATAAIADGYQMFGAFRTFGAMPLSPRWSWHYSGTMFWFRTAAILGDGIPPIKGAYGGTEAWTGDCIPAQNAECVFADGLGFKAPYDLNNWAGWIDEAFEWEVSRIGGPRTEQHQRELMWFLDRLGGVKCVLVIGSKHGGLEYHIGQRYPKMEIVSVDIDPQSDNAAPDMHTGSSRDAAIQKVLRTDYIFDAVFIDGDHSLSGVTADWEFAKSLDPAKIYLHDICDGLKHRREGCEVAELWQQIKADHVTDEKVVGCGWGGIGEVTWQT